MSPPFRYARILNALSFLMSRRSAISLKILAISWLSNPKAFGLDVIVEEPRAAGGKRVRDPCAGCRRTVAEQAAAAAGAAYLRCGGASRLRPRDQILDDGSGH